MESIKHEITEYWAKRAAQFSALHTKELHSAKRTLWFDEILHHLPQGDCLKILDVGTGSGFFALLLAGLGHDVTGIDLTEEMIAQAQETSRALGIPATFCVMDAEQPTFDDGCFDIVISRNLTWSLPHLDVAYAQWHRILRSGGVLLNFDADYCRETPMPQQRLPENHAHESIDSGMVVAYEQIKSQLKPTQQPRPQWDESLLREIGFTEIKLDYTLSNRLYEEIDEFYNPTPMFTISAVRR